MRTLKHDFFIYHEKLGFRDIIGLKTIEFGEKTQNKSYYGVQGHSRSSRWVPSNSPMRLPISDY